MTNSLKFTPHARILLFAPHPDDESLAAGGLLQRALRSGAQIRVIFGSDGDNNPWPQRLIEKKLMIKPEDRARWGARRREEALSALAHLGLPEDCAQFLGFPDQGITRFLLDNEEAPLAALCASIDNWQPTMIVMPSASDHHPDHNAFFVLLRLALARLGSRGHAIERLTYLVHSKGRHSESNRVSLKLRADEKTKKREAILCHGSQMALSKRRFTAYAKDSETFYRASEPAEFDSHHPVVTGSIEDGALRLLVHLRKRRSRFSGRTLYLAVESHAEGSVRWALPLPSKTGRVHVRHAGTGEKLRMATVRIEGRHADVRLPIAPLLPLSLIFVKLQRRVVFFDESGWREIALSTPPIISPEDARILAVAS